MDNRHQSEREYIRYHGATSGEHLVAGIHGLAHGKIHGRAPAAGPNNLLLLNGPELKVKQEVKLT